jgi:hypothetical protein
VTISFEQIDSMGGEPAYEENLSYSAAKDLALLPLDCAGKEVSAALSTDSLRTEDARVKPSLDIQPEVEPSMQGYFVSPFKRELNTAGFLKQIRDQLNLMNMVFFAFWSYNHFHRIGAKHDWWRNSKWPKFLFRTLVKTYRLLNDWSQI